MISPTDIIDNFYHMTAPYNMHDPMKTLFTQIDADVRYENSSGQPQLYVTTTVKIDNTHITSMF
jgi:hypothetical protein